MAETKKIRTRFPSKKVTQEVAGIANQYWLALLGPEKIYVDWTPSRQGRGGHSSEYSARKIGYKTDPGEFWRNGGHKTFPLFGRTREQAAEAAMKWADEKFGKREWVKDPFGAYQDARTIEAVWAKVEEAKTKKEEV